MFDVSRRKLVLSRQGIKYFFKNCNKHMEGCFANDWFIESGTEYYENGNIKFIREYNRSPRTYYGPRYFVSGKLFYESGGLWYEGSFHFKRSPTGYPLFETKSPLGIGLNFTLMELLSRSLKAGLFK